MLGEDDTRMKKNFVMFMTPMIMVLGLVGCGVATNSATTSQSKRSIAPIAAITLARLDALKNYQYKSVVVLGTSKTTDIGYVHSPTNYQLETTMTVPKQKPAIIYHRDVSGVPYFRIPGIKWQKGTPLTPALLDYATFTMDALKNPHKLRLVRTATVAGRSAREYHIIPVDAPRAFTTIWLDVKTGALLEYIQAPTKLSGVGVSTSTFMVTRVGGVPAWTVPTIP